VLENEMAAYFETVFLMKRLQYRSSQKYKDYCEKNFLTGKGVSQPIKLSAETQAEIDRSLRGSGFSART
jgi:hypothetical protein